MGRGTKLPDRLSWDFWFLLSTLPLCVAGIWWGWVRDSGAQTVIIGAAIIQFLVTRRRNVRLARMLRDNPEIAKIYYSTER